MSERDRLGPGRKQDEKRILQKDAAIRYGTDNQAIAESIELSNGHHANFSPEIHLGTNGHKNGDAKVTERFVREVIDTEISMQVQEIFEEDQNRATTSSHKYHLIEDSFSENNSGKLVTDDYSEESKP